MSTDSRRRAAAETLARHAQMHADEILLHPAMREGAYSRALRATEPDSTERAEVERAAAVLRG